MRPVQRLGPEQRHVGTARLRADHNGTTGRGGLTVGVVRPTPVPGEEEVALTQPLVDADGRVLRHVPGAGAAHERLGQRPPGDGRGGVVGDGDDAVGPARTVPRGDSRKERSAVHEGQPVASAADDRATGAEPSVERRLLRHVEAQRVERRGRHEERVEVVEGVAAVVEPGGTDGRQVEAHAR